MGIESFTTQKISEKETPEDSRVKSRESIMRDEAGLMERLHGRAKTLAQAMLVMSTISFGSVATREASAMEGLQVGKGETVGEFQEREASEERAIAFLGKLIQAHAPTDRPLSAAQKEILTRQAARVMVQGFAAQEKRVKEGLPAGEGVQVTYKDTCDAITVLNGASGEFAQRQYTGGISEAQREMGTNPGLKTLMEMSAQCK